MLLLCTSCVCVRFKESPLLRGYLPIASTIKMPGNLIKLSIIWSSQSITGKRLLVEVSLYVQIDCVVPCSVKSTKTPLLEDSFLAEEIC